MNSLLRRLALVLLLALGITRFARAGTIVFDSFTDPYPANPCLPVTQLPILFGGPYCDGASCPPSAVVQSPCGPQIGSSISQPGLPGVWGDFFRETHMDGHTEEITVEAHIDPVTQMLDLRHGAGIRGRFSLGYWLEDPATADMSGGGGEGIRFTISGDVSPSHPVYCVIDIYSMTGGDAWTAPVITSPGEFSLALADFDAVDPTFDLTQVYHVGILFSNCEPCDGPLPERHYAIGPIHWESGGPTSDRKTSWGRVKALFR